MKPSSLISALSSLIFSVRCLSCQKPSPDDLNKFAICSECRRFLQTDVKISFRGSLKIFAGSNYTPNMAKVILAAKEENQIQARNFLAERLTKSLERAITEISQNRNLQVSNVVIIPIPSRRAADRTRGFAHIELLITRLIFMNKSVNFQVLDCLSHAKKISDQSSLNFNERALNMKGAFAVNPILYFEIYPTINSNTVVFLLDDLVTTGATVQAANLALMALGARVDGVLASCATSGFTH